ncbi:MAG: YceI family protein [Rhodocyclaceae bacterium]|nr:YceI family protein [Rhodocyclaceae bacterium]
MKNAFAAVALAVAAAPAFAADSYGFDPRHTRPLFEVNHLGFSTQHGRFDKVDGRVTLDTAARQGSIQIVVYTASIDMGTDEWNRHMKSDEFFNADTFPTITFNSDKLFFDGDRVVGAEGRFTLLGVTKPLTIAVANFRCAPNPMTKASTCGADISATIKRSDFGMTKFLPAVGDEVKIFVPVEATKN